MATYTADILATEFARRKRKVLKQVTVNAMRKYLGKIQITTCAGFSADAQIPKDPEFRYILVPTELCCEESVMHVPPADSHIALFKNNPRPKMKMFPLGTHRPGLSIIHIIIIIIIRSSGSGKSCLWQEVV
jgi:hypothetical protein